MYVSDIDNLRSFLQISQIEVTKMTSAANQLSKVVEATLECPVCLSLPRDLPVPCCPSGHIVCRSCRTAVKRCPTCRQKMPANLTNSVLGSLIELVEHKCKFSDQGCDVKMLLRDLKIHEQRCPERTVECPFSDCGLTVQLKLFSSHAIETRHSILLGPNWMVFDIPSDNRALANGHWGMGIVSALGHHFHLNLRYHKPSKCFVISVWMAKSKARVEKYRAFIKLGGGTGAENELSFYGVRVTSVEDIPSIDSCMDLNGKYFLCIPRILLKNICKISDEDKNNNLKLRVQLVMSEI